MKNVPVALLILGLAAAPAWTQSKLDKAVKKAYEKLEDGKPDEAVKELTKATRDGGAPAWLAVGELRERLGQLDEAALAYEQAQGVASPALKPDVVAHRANFGLRHGSGREALALANVAVDAGETAMTLAVQARAQVRTLDAPGALETADRAVALDPSSALAHLARGEALFALGRNPNAEVALEKAVGLDPESALAYSRLARVLIALARPREAVAAARKATELGPMFGEGFAALGSALLAESPDSWGAAIAEAQQGAFLEPKNPVVLTAVGRVFVAAGRYEPATLAFRSALTADPGFAPARLALIQSELDRGNRDGALDLAREAQAEGATSPEIQYLIAVDAVRQDDYLAALGLLEKAIKGMPGNADAWALLGRAYQFNGRPDDAAEAYGKAVQLAPQNGDYRTAYGLLLGMTGDLEGGLENLEKVVEAPGYEKADAWANLGWTYRKMNQPEESISAYRRALQIDPELAQAHLGLGWAYHQTEAHDEAIAAYQKAASLDPQVVGDAYTGISWSYIFKSDAAQAKAAQQKAIAAGRTDTRLEEYITRLEQGLLLRREELERLREEQRKEAERAQKANEAFTAARSRSPERRARAARDLARYGGADASALDVLIYLMQADDSYQVRIAAARALGSLGRGARKAIPNLEGMIAQPQYTAPINPSKEELDLEMLDYDYHQAMRDALARIRGT